MTRDTFTCLSPISEEILFVLTDSWNGSTKEVFHLHGARMLLEIIEQNKDFLQSIQSNYRHDISVFRKLQEKKVLNFWFPILDFKEIEEDFLMRDLFIQVIQLHPKCSKFN
jgi:hypothetical protein